MCKRLETHLVARTSVTVSNLIAGATYYFAATTFDVTGLESDYSAEASYGVVTDVSSDPVGGTSNRQVYQPKYHQHTHICARPEQLGHSHDHGRLAVRLICSAPL